MLKNEWPASDYAIGSYIQATIADIYVDPLVIKPGASVLDIGCGEGAYSTKVIKKIPNGTMLGIDRSRNMLQLAHEKTALYPNFSVKEADVLALNFSEQFDYIVSFWCLQWCDDLTTAYKNMYRALKKGGKLMNIVPLGVDPLFKTLDHVKSTGEFPRLDHFKLPVYLEHVKEIPKILAQLPFKQAEAIIQENSILLPSLDVYRKFLNGLSFFHGQIPDDEIGAVNEAMVRAYDLDCQRKYQGQYRFDTKIYLVTAEK